MTENWTGYVCVQQSAEQDAAALLGSESWRNYFDFALVDLAVWGELERIRFWDKLNERCGVIVDRYEEEWINVDRLSDVESLIRDYLEKRRSLLGSSESAERARIFLHELLKLTVAAKQRGVPLIFAF